MIPKIIQVILAISKLVKLGNSHIKLILILLKLLESYSQLNYFDGDHKKKYFLLVETLLKILGPLQLTHITNQKFISININ